jgi:hypothetical protein
VTIVDQVHQAGLDYGQNAVLQASDVHRGRGACVAPGQPVGKLPAADQIAGVGESRRPPAIGALRVPADMVDV